MPQLEHIRGDFGSCRLGNCTFGKFPFVKIPLGSRHLEVPNILVHLGLGVIKCQKALLRLELYKRRRTD